MQLKTTESREVLVIEVDGPALDRKNTDRFKEEIAVYLRPGAKIALDLERVRHVDGSGCGAVLSLHREAAALGGEVRICSLHKPVRSLFQRLRLHRRVPTFNRRDEAVRSFQDVS